MADKNAQIGQGLYLPRVTIYDIDAEEYIVVFYGKHAEELASNLIGDLRDGNYDYSVSDDKCNDCGDIFWHEARELVVDSVESERNGKWVCPSCGGDPKENDDA